MIFIYFYHYASRKPVWWVGEWLALYQLFLCCDSHLDLVKRKAAKLSYEERLREELLTPEKKLSGEAPGRQYYSLSVFKQGL